MARQRWLIWLHRIGYVATALVAVEMVALGSVAGIGWWRTHRFNEQRRLDTAYKPGALRDPDYVVDYLKVLPHAAALGPDGLRFIAAPALGRQVYAVAMRRRPPWGVADGLLVITTYAPGHETSIGTERRSFRLSGESFRRLTETIDRRLTGFGGDKSMGTDGTSIAIERVGGGHLSSGYGNFIEPYRSLGEAVLTTIRPALPGVALPPPNNDWYPADG